MPPSKLRRAKAKTARLEQQYYRQKKMERKLDTREKIELGGLLVKAGLRNADKAFLYGMILEGAKAMNDTTELQRLTTLGRKHLEE